MGNEHGEWHIHGIDSTESCCIQSFEELISFVEKIGFIPLFQNQIVGFSVEEHTDSRFWWSGNTLKDPWEWRIFAANCHELAYGKFFNGKTGFISLEWLPVFANYRRSGYDFDSLWDDGLAQLREKKIMDCFDCEPEIPSFLLKRIAGFGRDGEKNFEGVLSRLQSMLYLVTSDFRQRLDRYGKPYGWPVSVYTTPENKWGYDILTSKYRQNPEISFEMILQKMSELYPTGNERCFRAVLER